MANKAMGKLTTVQWVLILGGAVVFWLLFLARRLNAAANAIAPGDLISRISLAIADAEGFNVEGSRPARNHNPGDLTEDLIGKGVGKDGPFIIYANDEDGFAALRKQVSNFFTGTPLYNQNMTIRQTAGVYTKNNAGIWANIVASDLGVTTDTTWSQLV